MRRALPAALLALVLSTSGCVHARWPAKVLGDGVPISATPIDGTIAQLRALPRPAGVDGFDAPRVPLERQVYRVRAALLRFTLATDGDIHLAIAQPGDPASTMIAEIPDPARMTNAPARYRDEVAQTRQDFIADFGKPHLDVWHNVHRQVEITGPIFFDAVHGQVGGPDGGVANGIEIHPVLSLKARPAVAGKT
jgi:hypothetical protein